MRIVLVVALVYAKAMKLKILLVEDEEDAYLLLKDWLEDLGKEQVIQRFATGNEALAFLETGNFMPNLIILDLKLPDQNGLEVLKAIKSNPLYQHVEVIVNSASEDPEHLKKTYRYGACAFLRKDGRAKTLLDTIYRLIMNGRIPDAR
jgi:CheY-like chemotaxis protein